MRFGVGLLTILCAFAWFSGVQPAAASAAVRCPPPSTVDQFGNSAETFGEETGYGSASNTYGANAHFVGEELCFFVTDGSASSGDNVWDFNLDGVADANTGATRYVRHTYQDPGYYQWGWDQGFFSSYLTIVNRPAPPPPPSTEPKCSAASIKSQPFYFNIIKSSAKGLKRQGIRRLADPSRFTGAVLNNVYTCAKGRVVGEVRLLPRHDRPILVSKGTLKFSYSSPGRTAVHLKPTAKGRRLLKRARRIRVRVSIRVYDENDDEVGYSTVLTLTR